MQVFTRPLIWRRRRHIPLAIHAVLLDYKREMVRTLTVRALRRHRAALQEGNRMSKHHITVTINGTAYEGMLMRECCSSIGFATCCDLTGTHIGCDTTSCGACTIIVDGKATKSCTMFAVQANGRQIMTVEGLEQNGKLHPLQEGFHEKHALQCGYCTPGMMMTSLALLQRNPNPSEHEIRVGISGNLLSLYRLCQYRESCPVRCRENAGLLRRPYRRR